AVKIDVDNCPADLGLLLYHFHEVLEGRGQDFSQQLSRKSDENISKMSKEIFEKVVTKISNYDLFPEKAEEGENINQLALKLLKKIIQDLEAFESDKTANGGKNSYAWRKLGA
ncbi:12480_t:CDS:2, partial [Racocetra persica]